MGTVTTRNIVDTAMTAMQTQIAITKFLRIIIQLGNATCVILSLIHLSEKKNIFFLYIIPRFNGKKKLQLNTNDLALQLRPPPLVPTPVRAPVPLPVSDPVPTSVPTTAPVPTSLSQSSPPSIARESGRPRCCRR